MEMFFWTPGNSPGMWMKSYFWICLYYTNKVINNSRHSCFIIYVFITFVL